MTIDAVYTSATFNSYVTAVEAAALIAAQAAVLGGDEGYSTKTTPEKEALILASAEALAKINFNGDLVPEVIAPNMVFPRSGLYHIGGSPVAINAIPQQVKNYCAAWVIYQLRNSKSKNAQPLKSKTVGSVSVTYSGNSGAKKPAHMSALGKLPPDWYTGVSVPGIANASIERRF
jgi:hypothetical protein